MLLLHVELLQIQARKYLPIYNWSLVSRCKVGWVGSTQGTLKLALPLIGPTQCGDLK